MATSATKRKSIQIILTASEYKRIQAEARRRRLGTRAACVKQALFEYLDRIDAESKTTVTR